MSDDGGKLSVSFIGCSNSSAVCALHIMVVLYF